MKFYVAVTDESWFEFLAKRQPDEVNFWRPTAGSAFRAICPGSLVLFKLHAPHNHIVGGGVYVRYEALPLWLAWDAFEDKNGAQDVDTLLQAISLYRETASLSTPIGCIILVHPFFLPRENWIAAPPGWHSNIVRGKTYDSETTEGSVLWARVIKALETTLPDSGPEVLAGATSLGEPQSASTYLAHVRDAQGLFRILVTDAYQRCCAITGEKVLPVLEAAHIKPYSKKGPNLVKNGLLLRRDIHTLFDQGYLTVTRDLRVEVSPAIREEFDNGKLYYTYHGKTLIQLPRSPIETPAREYLEWHNQKIFRAS